MENRDQENTVLQRPRVHVSVVSGADGRLILDCIDSALATTRGSPFDLGVTAVINDPLSDLEERLQARFPNIKTIRNGEPKGFAANHNAAIRGVSADYYLIANDDIVFLPGAIDRSMEYMQCETNAGVGVVGYRHLNADGSLQRSTYGFPMFFTAFLGLTGLRGLISFSKFTDRLASWVRRGRGRSRFWAHDQTLEVDTFAGAAMLVRAEAAAHVGPMDEVTLAGGEETEWHRRMGLAGWAVVFLHDAAVIHYGRRTVGKLGRFRAEETKGVLNFFWKHRSRLVFHALAVAVVPMIALRSLGFIVLGRRQRAAWEWEAARVVWRWGIRGLPAGGQRGGA